MCCGCDTSYIVSVHIQCQASIYTLSVCRGHSWRVRLAKQETLTPPGHLVSPLVCRGPWMSTVVLYCWCHSDSASVILYFTCKSIVWLWLKKITYPCANSLPLWLSFEFDLWISRFLSHQRAFDGLGCFEDLRCFNIISVMSQLGSRRYPNSEIFVASPRPETLDPLLGKPIA